MSVLDNLKGLIFGEGGGVFAKDERIAHSRFSDFLPWVAYNTDTQMYYLRDNAACWIFEASPLVLATPETYKTFGNIYKIDFPEGTVIQSIIYADPYVDDILDSFIDLRERNKDINPLFMAQALNYAEFIRDGTNGLRQLQGTPLKNFRFFFSIRIPIDTNFATDQDGWFEEVYSFS